VSNCEIDICISAGDYTLWFVTLHCFVQFTVTSWFTVSRVLIYCPVNFYTCRCLKMQIVMQ